jgi:hypothetical protein
MPYVTQDVRDALDADLAAGRQPQMSVPGELNYVLTIMIRYYEQQHGKSYGTINDIVGALDSCKMEFYRKIAAPYEDTKEKLNGPV